MPTTIAFDSKDLTRLLGKTPEAKEFISMLKRTLDFDRLSQEYLDDYPKTASAHYDVLNGIIEKCDALLNALKPLGLQKNPHAEHTDIGTANLIRHSRYLINREKHIPNNHQPNENKITDSTEIGNAVEKLNSVLSTIKNNGVTDKLTDEKSDDPNIDYPRQLFDSLIEFSGIVKHAAKDIKPRQGNSSKRNSESIRKENISSDFVRHYLYCFKKLPKTTKDGCAHKALTYCFDIAGFSEEKSSLTSLKTAIKKLKRQANYMSLCEQLSKSNHT